MQQSLLNHNPILYKFINIGLSIKIQEGYLIVERIPYVNSNREVKYGSIISNLNLSGDIINKPDTHVVYFLGDFPCFHDGSEITQLKHENRDFQLTNTISANRSFSNKNDHSYDDIFQKVINYINIIFSPVHLIDDKATPYNFLPYIEIESDDLYQFHYFDTNSSRGKLNEMNKKFMNQSICIIGLGGSGSYILDYVTKTSVKNIHLYDGDNFNTHNAFRAPGAPTLNDLSKNMLKVDYFHEIYSRMHKFIYKHGYYLNASNVQELSDYSFVFIAIDASESKKNIIEYLSQHSIPFIDTGISVEKREDSLSSMIRSTFAHANSSKRWQNKISFQGLENEYKTNIQIAEINSLAGIFAVIQWKKYLGFYNHSKNSSNFEFFIDDEILINE